MPTRPHIVLVESIAPLVLLWVPSRYLLPTAFLLYYNLYAFTNGGGGRTAVTEILDEGLLLILDIFHERELFFSNIFIHVDRPILVPNDCCVALSDN